jgi:prepilin-type N-terminal cleavage/methylation domain-containing protein
VSYNRSTRGRAPRRRPSSQPGRSLQPAAGRARRGGFTLVEILTAVAIIAILVSMAFLGFKYVSSSGKQKSTEVMLHNVRGMLAEFDAQSGRMNDILKAYKDTAGTAVPLQLTAGPVDPDSLHLLTSDDVIKTAYDVMPRLRAMPQNKAVLDGLPAEQVYPRRWSATKDVTKKAPYASDDMRSYQKDERVQSGNGFYKCTAAYTVDAGNPSPPETDGGHWAVDLPNLLVLDAWGAPLIFVPPVGAVNLTEGGIKHVAGPPGPTGPKQGPDRKAYFMSAGPDRDFAAGDDNVYSFENR